VTNEVLQLVSKLKLTDQGQSVLDKTSSVSGDVYIVKLNAVEKGDVSTVSQQVKDSTRRLIQRRNGESLISSYLDALREEYQPEINQELL
jgi:hypothetical protein